MSTEVEIQAPLVRQTFEKKRILSSCFSHSRHVAYIPIVCHYIAEGTYLIEMSTAVVLNCTIETWLGSRVATFSNSPAFFTQAVTTRTQQSTLNFDL